MPQPRGAGFLGFSGVRTGFTTVLRFAARFCTGILFLTAGFLFAAVLAATAVLRREAAGRFRTAVLRGALALGACALPPLFVMVLCWGGRTACQSEAVLGQLPL